MAPTATLGPGDTGTGQWGFPTVSFCDVGPLLSLDTRDWLSVHILISLTCDNPSLPVMKEKVYAWLMMCCRNFTTAFDSALYDELNTPAVKDSFLLGMMLLSTYIPLPPFSLFSRTLPSVQQMTCASGRLLIDFSAACFCSSVVLDLFTPSAIVALNFTLLLVTQGGVDDVIIMGARLYSSMFNCCDTL